MFPKIDQGCESNSFLISFMERLSLLVELRRIQSFFLKKTFREVQSGIHAYL